VLEPNDKQKKKLLQLPASLEMRAGWQRETSQGHEGQRPHGHTKSHHFASPNRILISQARSDEVDGLRSRHLPRALRKLTQRNVKSSGN